MKLYSLLFALAFTVAGCSSSNDDSSMDDTDTATGSALSVSNYESFLPVLVKASNLDDQIAVGEKMRVLFMDMFSGDPERGFKDEVRTSAECFEFNCSVSGTLERCGITQDLSPFNDDGTLQVRSETTAVFSQCMLSDGAEVSGNVSMGGRRLETTFASNDLEVSATEFGFARLNGAIALNTEIPVGGNEIPDSLLPTNSISFSGLFESGSNAQTIDSVYQSPSTENGGFITTTISSYRDESDIQIKRISGGFDLSGAIVGTEKITVNYVDIEANPATEYYNQGSLTAEVGPGGQWLLNFDNGNTESMQLDITESGSASSFEIPITDELRLREFPLQ